MARKLLLVFASLTLIIAGAALYLSLTKTQVVAGTKTPKRPILVATGDLPPGTTAASLTDLQVQVIQVDPVGVPPAALTSIAQVANLKTIVPIFKGQTLITRQFAQTSATGGLPIPQGKNAISVELQDDRRVAGFVQPGSQVVVYTVKDTVPLVLLTSASVIAIGPTTATGKAPTADQTIASTIVTFALTTADATKLVGADSGSLYLGLLPS
jgi:pilus assembly protein CpaB